MGRVLLVFVVLGWVGVRAQLEPEFTQRLGVEAEASETRLLELASWSRERGWEREALHALALCVNRFPASVQGHEMLHEEQIDGRWLPAVVDPSTLRAPPVDLSTLDSRRPAALAATQDRVFTMARSSFIFDFWTDLDRSRVESYVQAMNPHYSKLKNFFRLSRTEAGAKVFLFSSRSEYLAFYMGVTEKSGEHTEGFFASLGGVRFLAFYDTPPGETIECKVCDKGRLKCTLCRGSGDIDCPTCAGKGRVPRPCAACFSAGWVPCPGSQPSKPCHLCEGQGRMPCPTCLGEGHDSVRCEQCAGWGARPCERSCIAGRVVCADCSGTGRVYKVFVDSNTKAGSSKCVACGGRGYAQCDACQATGFVSCPVQEAGGDCSECQGTGKIGCAAGV